MERSSRSAWLDGPSDLREEEVHDVPVKGQSVLVRGLPAAYSNRATSEALELITGPRGEQTATINTEKMEILQFLHGVIDPKFNEDEVRQIAEKFGPAFKLVIAKIDELSGVDKEAIERTQAAFPAGGSEKGGTPLGNGASSGSG